MNIGFCSVFLLSYSSYNRIFLLCFCYIISHYFIQLSIIFFLGRTSSRGGLKSLLVRIGGVIDHLPGLFISKTYCRRPIIKRMIPLVMFQIIQTLRGCHFQTNHGTSLHLHPCNPSFPTVE